MTEQMTPTAPDIAERFTAGSWEFTPDVAAVFSDHVRASVPFYDAIQQLVAEATDWLVPRDGVVADLGAATGATVDCILERHPERAIHAHLYDEQPAMLARAKTFIRNTERVRFHARRIEDGPLDHDGADLTACLFTLQFMSPAARREALYLARKASAPTGALIVAEKVRVQDARWAEIGTDVSHDWKAQHGISADAIRAKARALRGVLVPQPLDELVSAVRDAGWASSEVLFKWHQWVVLGAFATGHNPNAGG
jgi:tRNA (cmo5U34)-methyltransferase